MIDELRLTIDDLKRRRDSLAAIVAKLDQAISFLRQIFDGESSSTSLVPPPSGVLPPAKVPPEQVSIKSQPAGSCGRIPKNMPKNMRKWRKPSPGGNIPAPDSQKRHGDPKKTFSQYKGVTNGLVRNDGIQRYKAVVYLDKRNKCLGTFLIEEEAAAAVQAALGNKAEANRLQVLAKQKKTDLAEQRENNPDRGEDQPESESPGGGLPPAGHTASAWECNKCGRQHLQVKRPKACEKCGKDNGFAEIK